MRRRYILLQKPQTRASGSGNGRGFPECSPALPVAHPGSLFFPQSYLYYYLKIVTNKLANDTRIEVAENHKLVLLPISELRAFALLGVT